MKFRFLNKTFENRRFDYTPMYYDERKENLKRKKEQYRKLKNEKMSDDERTAFFKDNLRNEWSRTHVRSEHYRSANIRTLVLIVLIVGLGYLIFNGLDDVDTIAKKIF